MVKAFYKEIERISSQIAKSLGFSELDAKIFTTLYLDPEEVALEDISKRTGYSLSTISTKMKSLENCGILQRKRRPGSKKVYYYMKKNLLEINLQNITKIHEGHIMPMKYKLPKILDKYHDRIMNGKDERLKNQFKIMQDYLKMISKFDILLRDFMKKLNEMLYENDNKA